MNKYLFIIGAIKLKFSGILHQVKTKYLISDII